MNSGRDQSYNRQSILEVSESSFDYILGELLLMQPKIYEDETLNTSADKEFAICQRLDETGYSVGFRLIEKISSQHRYLGSDSLDIVKFLCKEFWEFIFRKKIDKLQTNHKGVFVLSDYKFKWLERYSSDDMASKQAAVRMLNFPCGILRGALANLGLQGIVNAEFNNFPGCTFHIRLKTS